MNVMQKTSSNIALFTSKVFVYVALVGTDIVWLQGNGRSSDTRL